MTTDRSTAPAPGRPSSPRDPENAWFGEAKRPLSRDDVIAEALALVALLFAVAIGLAIALLPARAHAASTSAATAPAAASAPAAAASQPSLVLSAFKVVAALPGAPEHLVPATLAHAGDQLEYQAVYRNPTKAAVHHVVVTVPVPEAGVEYVLDTDSPRADLASTDGKRFAALPLQRTETTADGRTLAKPAPGGDYRFLRWELGDVASGATRTVRTRVRLLPTSVATR